MLGKIIIFRLSRELTRADRGRFYREFYGYVDRSHHGRYRYERGGLLSRVPHIMPARSVIVVNRRDSRRVLDFLEEHGALVYAWDIWLTDADLKKLGMS